MLVEQRLAIVWTCAYLLKWQARTFAYACIDTWIVEPTLTLTAGATSTVAFIQLLRSNLFTLSRPSTCSDSYHFDMLVR
jgi:hypothetical protein